MTLGPIARPWYPGRSEPDEAIIALFASLDPKPQVLYDQANAGASAGEYADALRGIYGKMDSLKRNPVAFRSWTEEDGLVTFYDVLLDLAPGDMRGRVQILQQLGAFKFRAGADGEEKKKVIGSVFAPPGEEEDPNIISSSRARRLNQIWSATSESMLSHVIARPALAGRVLSDRLNPANTKPLRLLGHRFEDVRSTALQPIAEARVAAFERAGEVHVISPVRETLEKWNADAAGAGVESISLLEALLLHELVELVLDEIQADLSPLASHVVATAFERYLKGNVLTVAVDDFFLDWPPLSAAEQEERTAKLLDEELREAEAMFAEEGPPQYQEEDVGHLPVDPARSPARKKVAKKGAVKKKMVKKKRP
ncbi:MAG: hypothetical protein ABIL09_16590 [Gemmatimonadota bacterium]